ncbi:glycerophosphodiester phosphodiesterase [Rhodohalobacter mucosus]|uniref:glycerophosphodiester phosphodiesterase n=1 Tax=Rhodohalobacter mucosus TaxID=2079485 RepID=UPI0011B21301|nr:glycerophosphodiester phosphodiesterase [Rhodohalobacter mucosus]
MVLKQILKPSHHSFLAVAHRGASAEAPENTMAAFELALKQGADMIEIDILPSSDGVPIVIHDTRTKRLTGIKADIRNLHSEEIARMHIQLMKNSGYGSEPIPTLNELLAWSKGKVLLNIEIKPEGFNQDDPANILSRTLSLIDRYAMQHSVLISSFSTECIRQCRKKAPAVATGLLYDKRASAGLRPIEACLRTGAVSLHTKKRRTTKKMISKAADRDIPVMVYTVNRRRRMKKLIQHGVKGIFTDKPSLLREVVLTMNS